MIKLTTIELEDGTQIHIQSTDTVEEIEAISTNVEPEKGRTAKSGVVKKTLVNFQALQSTIRAYTQTILNSFHNLGDARIESVTLEFGIEIGGEAGIPYITKGNASSNVKVIVQCNLADKTQ
jgi:hypothetical protein